MTVMLACDVARPRETHFERHWSAAADWTQPPPSAGTASTTPRLPALVTAAVWLVVLLSFAVLATAWLGGLAGTSN